MQKLLVLVVLLAGCNTLRPLNDPGSDDAGTDGPTAPDARTEDAARGGDGASTDLTTTDASDGDADFVRMVPPTPQRCQSVIHPQLYPTSDVLEGEPIQRKLSFTTYRDVADAPKQMLVYRNNRAGDLFDSQAFEVTPQGVVERLTIALPPGITATEGRDVAVGRARTAGFDLLVSGENATECANNGAGFLWIQSAGDTISPSGVCPAPVWAAEFGGGYNAFADTPNDQRAVYFEDSGAVSLAALHAPYAMSDYRGTPFPDVSVGEGWIDTTGGDLVLVADSARNLHVWDTALDSPNHAPTALGRTGTELQNALEALDQNRYVLVWADGDAVNVDIYQYDPGSGSFSHAYRADRFSAVNEPATVDVAGFPGGFAVFIEEGGERWTVHTYEENTRFGPTGCEFSFGPYNIEIRDVELSAYRQGDALQVLAAVHFALANQRQYINVEGPRWTGYFGN